MFDIQAVDAAISRLVEEQHLAGVSVCVKNAAGTVFEKGYGVRDAKGTPVDPDTMFGIASMSKSITALALCILQCEGKLRLDDPVCRYIPTFSIPGAARDAVTIRHLCMHTAGIPPMEPLEWSIAMNSANREDDEWAQEMCRKSPNKMDRIEQIIEYIANCTYPMLGAPGEYMSYSNEGYAILSYVVDAAAGVPLEQYAAEHIFAPLGMTRTIMDDDCVSAHALSGGNITSLFERVNGQTRVDDDWSILPPFRGCAMVKSTSRDMAAYYRALASGGMHEGKQAIPAEAVELLIGRAFPESDYDVYCLGLNKFRRLGHVFCEHSGGLHGVSTKGALIKDEDLGFAVLCNQGDEDMDDIMWVLYSAILGLPLDTCFRRFAPVGRAFSDEEMLLGCFTGHEGIPSHLRIWQEDGQLMGERDGSRYMLRWCGATRFLGYKTPDAKTPAARLEFLLRDGKAWGVRAGTRILQRDQETAKDAVLDVLEQRRSVRAYTGAPIADDKLMQILSAGLLGGSGKALYPAEMVVIRDRTMLESLSGCRVGAAGMLAGAACAVVVIADAEKSDTWVEDASIMLANMQLMAERLGVGTCWVQGRGRTAPEGCSTEDFVRRLVSFPQRFRLEAILSMGIPAEHPPRKTADPSADGRVHFDRY